MRNWCPNVKKLNGMKLIYEIKGKNDWRKIKWENYCSLRIINGTLKVQLIVPKLEIIQPLWNGDMILE